MKPLPALAVLFLVSFAVLSIAVKREVLGAKARPAAPLAIEVDAAVPTFALETLDGATVRLRDVLWRKKLVVVVFWASWSGSSRLLLRVLEMGYHREDGRGLDGKGVEILALVEDEDPARAAAYLARHPVSFPVLVDAGGAVARRWGVNGVPLFVGAAADGRAAFAGDAASLVGGLQSWLAAEQEAAGG